METTREALPDDIEALKALVLAAQAEAAAERAARSDDRALIAALKLTIEKLKRERFGAKAERTSRLIDQMELQLEELEATATEDELAAEASAARTTTVASFQRKRPTRQPFPAHLPRERVVVPGPTSCSCYGSARLRKLGEDVTETRRRRAERASDQQLRKVPSARTIAHLMTTARNHLSKSDTMTTAAIEAGVPMLVEARALIDRFQAMIRTKSADDLGAWVTDASKSLVASFASGVMRDRAAVQTAITEPWSNGQTKGQITKLKLVKRQMYGRGKLDLLQARLIGAA